MKNLIILFLLFTLFSCTKKNYIYYEYNGVTITRIDIGNEIYFYYGKYSYKDKIPSTYIMATYSGFNSEMGAYIDFLPNKNVNIIRMYGSFDKIGKDSLLSLRELNSTEYWIENIKGNYNNVIELMDITKLEKERNISNHSKVKATYPNNQNF